MQVFGSDWSGAVSEETVYLLTTYPQDSLYPPSHNNPVFLTCLFTPFLAVCSFFNHRLRHG
jgi:hypothetical protein